MKFAVAHILTAFLSTLALAQRVSISAPADGTSVAAGSNITVEIDRPNSLSASTEVAVVIALQTCQSLSCLSPSDFLGSVLYNGGYNPVQMPPTSSKPPHQNFTVTIPASTPSGLVQLGVVHVSLIGAGPEPFMETTNITLNIT